MDRVFQHAIHVTGAAGANITPIFTAPFDCQLIHVSAVGSNANDATIAIGTTAEASDAIYLAAAAVGDSSAPVVFTKANFVDAQYPCIAKGTVALVTVDFDGDGGAAVADLTIVLTFTEG